MMIAPAMDVRPSWRPQNLSAINRKFEDQSARDLLHWGNTVYKDDMVLATGFGVSGVVLMHMLSQIRPNPSVFYIDTGLLFQQTYALRDQLAERLGINFIRVHAGLSIAAQREQFGDKLWQSNPNLCCGLRKVEPLQNHLANKKAWVTAIRRDQSASRAQTQTISWDSANHLIKLCPIVDWTRKQVWDYVLKHDLPYNRLLDQGYKSIGCTHCTRAVGADESVRAGRWAGTNKVECGIHVQPSGTSFATR